MALIHTLDKRILLYYIDLLRNNIITMLNTNNNTNKYINLYFNSRFFDNDTNKIKTKILYELINIMLYKENFNRIFETIYNQLKTKYTINKNLPKYVINNSLTDVTSSQMYKQRMRNKEVAMEAQVPEY